MREIPLNQGYVAMVDDSDYQRVMDAGPWFARIDKRNANVYATHHVRDYIRNRQASEPLHRFILNVSDSGVHIDHAPDRSGLNCQRAN